MKNLVSYIDDLKEKTGSDYRTAKILGISKTTISHIRSRGQCGDDLAMKIALLLDKEPSELLIAAAIARSEGTAKTEWEKISKRMGIAAGLMMPVSIAISAFHEFLNGEGMYIMLNYIL